MDSKSCEGRTERLNYISCCIPKSGIYPAQLVNDIISYFDCTEITARSYIQALLISNRIALINYKLYPSKTLVQEIKPNIKDGYNTL